VCCCVCSCSDGDRGVLLIVCVNGVSDRFEFGCFSCLFLFLFVRYISRHTLVPEAGPLALILAPVRELVLQIADEIRKLGASVGIKLRAPFLFVLFQTRLFFFLFALQGCERCWRGAD
jgi:hypothetical protein